MRTPKRLLAGLAFVLLLAGCLSGGDQDGTGGEEESIVDPYSDAGAPGTDNGATQDEAGGTACIDTTTGEPAEGFHNPCPQGEYPASG